ncbi:HemK family protein methyltransferase [Patescibacteria group bacterium]|nr:HemK family protein methyltransferase [Patescibacteria group bacterium]MDE2173367.1 HemK family protein methyltransferase [Patescibacteria group bacterium]
MYLSQEAAKQKILQEKYGGITNDAFRADCARIEAHEPWEYVLGYADFLDCRIDLSERPMVPREETAFWVKRVIEEWKDAGRLNALDLYAGSGNIGIALAKHLPLARVSFNELDKNLLPQIARSLEINSIDTSRTTLIAGDSLEKIKGTFDVICANPPYVDPAGVADMDPEMRYEPHIAFFGSSDGFAQHRELIRGGKKYLTPKGVLYVECDMTQVKKLKQILAGTDWNWEFWDDPYGNEGVMVLRHAV